MMWIYIAIGLNTLAIVYLLTRQSGKQSISVDTGRTEPVVFMGGPKVHYQKVFEQVPLDRAVKLILNHLGLELSYQPEKESTVTLVKKPKAEGGL